jgi:hypothetical protein
VGTESGGSLLYKNNMKMAELPKDFNPTGSVGFFIGLVSNDGYKTKETFVFLLPERLA